MLCTRCLRRASRPRIHVAHLHRARASNSSISLLSRQFSQISLRRPQTVSNSSELTFARPSLLSSLLIRTFSSTPTLSGPRNTFNPSHFVRKRRHGFLSRLRTKNGRKILKRRRLKRRTTLSH
ncbi:hypothetical protein EV356DRAFT_171107 [Viridothelium virens]|uniref:Large ribosomal subunit protein bL34m n=1 Tax=Viridothelium virens TaxID=1048519 RepID=A0A6A6HMY4_VIRVR|nr:hypothetical protein EV356DRAFT_171107 [Viridothelium virens]